MRWNAGPNNYTPKQFAQGPKYRMPSNFHLNQKEEGTRPIDREKNAKVHSQ